MSHGMFNAGIAHARARSLGRAVAAFEAALGALRSHARPSASQIADVRQNLGVVQLQQAAGLRESLLSAGAADAAVACEAAGSASCGAHRAMLHAAGGARRHLIAAHAFVRRQRATGTRSGGGATGPGDVASLRRDVGYASLISGNATEAAHWLRRAFLAEAARSPPLPARAVSWAAELLAAEAAASCGDAAGSAGTSCQARSAASLLAVEGPASGDGLGPGTRAAAAEAASQLLGPEPAGPAGATVSPDDALAVSRLCARTSPGAAAWLALTSASLGAGSAASLRPPLYESLRVLRGFGGGAAAAALSRPAVAEGVWREAGQQPAVLVQAADGAPLLSEPFPGCPAAAPGADAACEAPDWARLAAELEAAHGAPAVSGLAGVRRVFEGVGAMVRDPAVVAELRAAAGGGGGGAAESLVGADGTAGEAEGTATTPVRDGEGLESTGRWRQVVLARDGRLAAAPPGMPRAAEAVRRLYSGSPEGCGAAAGATPCVSALPALGAVELSVLGGGTSIREHCGPSNSRWRIHASVRVPGGGGAAGNASLSVAGRRHVWREGGTMLFDDSFWHAVDATGLDPAAGPRVVLIADVWHPALLGGPEEARRRAWDATGARRRLGPGGAPLAFTVPDPAAATRRLGAKLPA